MVKQAETEKNENRGRPAGWDIFDLASELSFARCAPSRSSRLDTRRAMRRVVPDRCLDNYIHPTRMISSGDPGGGSGLVIDNPKRTADDTAPDMHVRGRSEGGVAVATTWAAT
jgi:hypothetical protein